jgi:hypothetical protein
LLKKIAIGSVVLFVIGLGIFSFPNLRHFVVNGVLDFPEFAFKQILKADVINRNFDNVGSNLVKYGVLVKKFGPENNRLVPGYVENIKWAYDATMLSSERKTFLNALELAFDLSPKNIDVAIMLAKTNMIHAPEDAIDYLSGASGILPSHPEIQKIMSLAMSRLDPELASKLCIKISDTGFGDYEGSKSSTLTGGGLRRVLFGFDSPDNPRVWLHEGVVMGEEVSYSFLLPDLPSDTSNPFFVFPSSGGVGIEIIGLDLYKTTALFKKFNFQELGLEPEHGMTIGNIIYSNYQGGEKVYLKDDLFVMETPDKLTLKMVIHRLNNSSLCSVKK